MKLIYAGAVLDIISVGILLVFFVILMSYILRNFDKSVVRKEIKLLSITQGIFTISYATLIAVGALLLTDLSLETTYDAILLAAVSPFLGEVVPICTVFFIHWRNFSKEMIELHVSDVRRATLLRNSSLLTYQDSQFSHISSSDGASESRETVGDFSHPRF